MASTALSVLSGIGAAAAGLAGEKVSKTGSIPGLDIAAIIPALLGSKAAASGGEEKAKGKAGDLLGKVATVASIASKTGLLKNTKLGNIADLADTLLSVGKTSGKAAEATDGIAGLAAAIMGGSGTGANLASIATLASTLGKTAETDKEKNSMAAELGKTLASKFGVSLAGTSSAVKGLDKVMEEDTKTDLFKSILKGIMK